MQSVVEEKKKCQFSLEKFSGPMDLLLFLIQENKVDIYDIPISEITEQFLSYIESFKADIEEMADFYKLAADLLYIKSRMLLPVDVALDEEYEDPRQELVERLIEYQKFKKYADLLSGSSESGRFFIPRRENLFLIPYEDQDLIEGVSLLDLFATFKNILETRTVPDKIFNVYEEVSVNEKEALMLELFEKNDMITLSDLIVDFSNPLHIICAFMAILETTKWKTTYIMQYENYGEIYITKREGSEISASEADEIDYKAEILPDSSGFVDDTLEEEDENEEMFIGDEEEIILDDEEE